MLAAIGLFVSVALVAPAESASVLAGPGGVLTAVGRVTAMSGTYLLLVTLLLIARIPAVERAIGQDRLVKLHRKLGPAILGLIGIHVVTVVLGYAAQVATGPWHELVLMATTFPGMMLAVAGLGLLFLAGFTSYRYVRRRMKYETWWAVHLYTYLAVALSIPHQILTGAPFIGHPLATAWWLTLWFATAGAVIVYRWGLPVARSLQHKVTVHSVEEEAPGVVSVTMTGRHLDKLEASGGQFLHWRFLKRGMWWQAHPYSLSAVPTANRMRITVKDLGDHSSSLAAIEPGTRVAIEGPYGAFTHHARHTDRVVLVAAGVGVTPVRALLEDLPRHVDVVAILRGAQPARPGPARRARPPGGRARRAAPRARRAALARPPGRGRSRPARARHRRAGPVRLRPQRLHAGRHRRRPRARRPRRAHPPRGLRLLGVDQTRPREET